MVAPFLSLEMKRKIVEKSIVDLAANADGVIIAMPQRQRNSITNTIFIREPLHGISFCMLGDPESQYYAFCLQPLWTC